MLVEKCFLKTEQLLYIKKKEEIRREKTDIDYIFNEIIAVDELNVGRVDNETSVLCVECQNGTCFSVSVGNDAFRDAHDDTMAA